MKIQIIIFLALIIISLVTSGCEKNQSTFKLPKCNNFKNEEIKEIFNNTLGKVVINHSYYDTLGNEKNVYAITIATQDFDRMNWTPSKDSILVPCNLPEDYQENNLLIKFSGKKYYCCDLLTQPEFRASYGCLLELMDIQKID